MSSVASPFGLKPTAHPSGVIRSPVIGTLASGLASNIFQFAPIQVDANGFIVPAAPGARILGAFLGVEFTGTDGRRQYRNNWTTGTVGTEIVVYYSEDPLTIYQIQADGPITQAQIGQQYDWSAQAGNTTTGLSSVALAVASAAANAGLRVIGIPPAPDNVVGDAFTIVQVQISEHQYVADIASV